MKLFARSLTLAALLGITSVANAQNLAFDATGSAATFYGGTSLTAGYTFNVITPLTVTELEMYGGFGLVSPTIPVGIWDSGGTLLTSATISTTAPAATTPSANGGNFFGIGIAPIALTPGLYTIGALGIGNDMVAFTGTIIANPAVTYGDAGVNSGTSLTQPTPLAPGVALLGPSFKFTTAAPVPEPGSIALLVGMATVGVGVLRKRRK